VTAHEACASGVGCRHGISEGCIRVMKLAGVVLSLSFLVAHSAFAGSIDQIAENLQISCSNHFRKEPNRPSKDSKKFCSCFADDFTSAFSLREVDLAAGVLTPEIQQQFERSAEYCGRDVPAFVAQSGKAWALDAN
jgi:hypothetical protein